MINEESAELILAWVDEAVSGGASVLTGGGREGTTVEPTVPRAPSDAKVSCDEVSGR